MDEGGEEEQDSRDRGDGEDEARDLEFKVMVPVSASSITCL